MIEVRGLSKHFGDTVAVDGLDFTVRPGEVTGFLGPNGAGKTTTLRMILGLDAPTAGTVTFRGRTFAELPAPLREVGVLLDARAVHPSRTAAQHLRALALSNEIDLARVPQVLEAVGLEQAADQRAAAFSLGMLQRLGLAAALLGDPTTLVLDEPLNGLDPEGIVWFRRLMRRLAAEGRTVLVSSHLMAEMALTADHLLVIGAGRLLADTGVKEFIDANARVETIVRTPDAESFGSRLADAGATIRPLGAEEFAVTGLESAKIGAMAAAQGVELHQLATRRRSLEEAFMELTGETTAHASRELAPGTGAEPAYPLPESEPADQGDPEPGEDTAQPTRPTRPERPAQPTRPGQPGSSGRAGRAGRGGWRAKLGGVLPGARAGRGRPARPVSRQPGFGSAVRSEWVKLVTSRQARFLALGTVVAGAGLAVLTSNSAAADYVTMSASDRLSFDPVEVSLRGHLVAQLTVSLLGALCITSEYTTGTITSSLTAVPQRGRLLAAKAAVVTAVVVPTSLAAMVGGFLGGQALLAKNGAPHLALTDPEALRAVLGGSAYLTVAGLLGLGLGGLVRSATGTTGALFGTMLMVPAVSPALPGKLSELAQKYWPTRAGTQVMTVVRDPGLLDPATGLTVMAVVTGGLMGACYVVFRHRDA